MIDMNTKFIHYGNNKSASTACKLSSNDLNSSRSETFGFYNTESLMCGISSFSDVGTSKALKLNCNAGPTKLNKILSEEINKSNKIKKDIDDILNGKSRSVSLPNSLEEPTKDVCTEIMDSLSKDTKNRVSKKNKRCFTIAVNTEPIGLLGLLKISKETIRQILSYMPRIDYNSYLSMVQFPQLSKIGESDYICNICGAAFCRPSQLSEHIQKHNLDNTRNCCVCRHALDSKRRSALFSCRYCHQPFIRAYCCELHQRSCAKNFGVRHAESGNLAMLT
ncbi:uncharacterized protein LOC114249082 [Bombyx mandarina]|uniref:Uncharacterized protein LOC114249082 n=1 Tax=Bombyx mandarina TaxID=7092 RepID=A0A6J2K8R0_BOMMA|nr:uncharacterized protein LOC114249082 [Bombyx mandarina]